MGGGIQVIERNERNIKKISDPTNFNILILFLGGILVLSVILSSAVSAADLDTLTQSNCHDGNLNNVDHSNNLAQTSTHTLNFHKVGAIKSAVNGNFIIGRLKIPRLGVYCSIRSDTVNAYNAAYHYPESVSFGRLGECGIMSHRTTYSALFRHLDWLKIGDKVVINDPMNIRYIYSVTSNGNDIRWDYKTNPIKFADSGPARLLLVTCYPPGYEKAAFITHCKLISVDYPPRVLTTAPQNMKINTNRTSTIAIKFSEKIKINTYYSSIRVKNLNTNKFVPIYKTIRENMLYIKTIYKRSVNTWYQVTIPNEAIKDYTGTNLQHTYIFKFKTGL